MVAELTHQEASEMLGVPLGTVLSRVSRARNRLREYLTPTQNKINPERIEIQTNEEYRSEFRSRFCTGVRNSVLSNPFHVIRRFQTRCPLRDVPLPDGLLDRLMVLPLAGDEDVDELLRDVAVPPGLLERLQAIALADDEGLDEALRDVPVPDDLVASCRHHARRHLARREGRHRMDRALRISRIAMAVSLIMAVTLSLGSAMLLSWSVNGFGCKWPAGPRSCPNSPPTPAENRLETSWRHVADDAVGSGRAAFAAG